MDAPFFAPQEVEEKGTYKDEGQTTEESKAIETRPGVRQRAMEEGLLETHGLEFDKKWIRLVRVIKAQVRRTDEHSASWLYHSRLYVSYSAKKLCIPASCDVLKKLDECRLAA